MERGDHRTLPTSRDVDGDQPRSDLADLAGRLEPLAKHSERGSGDYSVQTLTPLARDAFILDAGLVYLNHAAVGVLPRATHAALAGMLDAHARRGVIGVAPYEADLPQYREAIGAFIGATGSEIAVLRNTGDGANVIAHGLDWAPGDEIVLCDDEFGANAYPWLALRERGVLLRFIETARERMTPDALRRVLTTRTRLVALSWVGFHDGYRHDLAALGELAHANGSLFVVDAIQGLGAFPIDVRSFPCDALYAGGAKWLMALQGVSFLFVRSELLERIKLRLPGWRSVADMWDFLDYTQSPAPDASRFEGGTPNFLGALSLATSIEILRRAGPERIAAHVLALTDRLVEGLLRAGAKIASVRAGERRSGIVTFTLPDRDPRAVGVRLGELGYCATFRAGGIRVAPHGYNTAAEIDGFLEVLATCA